MKRAILSAALAVAFVAGVAAQAKPNFAGTWTLDPEKSVMGGGGGGGRQGGMAAGQPITITVDGQKMSITRTMGQSGNTVTTVYMLDGTESKNQQMGRQGGEPVTITYVSTWEGNALVTKITNPRGTSTEKRWLEADGTMVVEQTRTGPDGTPVTAKLVYKKTT